MTTIHVLCALSVTVLLTACTASTVTATRVNNHSTTTMENDINTEDTQASKAPRHAQLSHARADLAQRLGIVESQIELVSQRSVTWRSGAMGCPKPGMMYTQALVPGRLILLRVGQKTYRYHADQYGDPVHCPNDRAETPGTDPSDL